MKMIKIINKKFIKIFTFLLLLIISSNITSSILNSNQNISHYLDLKESPQKSGLDIISFPISFHDSLNNYVYGSYSEKFSTVILYQNTTDNGIYVANSSDLISWHNIVKISGSYSNLAQGSVLALSNGTLFALFESGSWPQSNCYYLQTNDLINWSPIRQATNDNYYEGNPKLFELSSNRVGLTYYNGPYSTEDGVCRIYNNGVWSAPRRVYNVYQSPNVGAPTVFVNSTGDWTMLFAKGDPSQLYITFSQNEGIDWTTPEIFRSNIHSNSYGLFYENNSYHLFYGHNGDEDSIFYENSTDFITWSEPIPILTVEEWGLWSYTKGSSNNILIFHDNSTNTDVFECALYPDSLLEPLEYRTLKTDLGYPKGLWIHNNNILYTETADRNTIFDGNLTLCRFDLTSEQNQVLIDHPICSDSVVVAQNGTIYLSSYMYSNPGENGRFSAVDPTTNIETVLFDIEIATKDMYIDSNDDIYLLGSSDSSDAKSLYYFPVGDYYNPQILKTGLGRVWSISKQGDYIYFANFSSINRFHVSGGPTEVFLEKSHVLSMTMDDQYIYYADYFGGTIGKISISNSSDETLLSGLNKPSQIRYDGIDNLYFLECGTGDNEYSDGTLKVYSISGNFIPPIDDPVDDDPVDDDPVEEDPVDDDPVDDDPVDDDPVDDVSDNPFAFIPGYSTSLVLVSLGLVSIGLIKKNSRKKAQLKH